MSEEKTVVIDHLGEFRVTKETEKGFEFEPYNDGFTYFAYKGDTKLREDGKTQVLVMGRKKV